MHYTCPDLHSLLYPYVDFVLLLYWARTKGDSRISASVEIKWFNITGRKLSNTRLQLLSSCALLSPRPTPRPYPLPLPHPTHPPPGSVWGHTGNTLVVNPQQLLDIFRFPWTMSQTTTEHCVLQRAWAVNYCTEEQRGKTKELCFPQRPQLKESYYDWIQRRLLHSTWSRIQAPCRKTLMGNDQRNWLATKCKLWFRVNKTWTHVPKA